MLPTLMWSLLNKRNAKITEDTTLCYHCSEKENLYEEKLGEKVEFTLFLNILSEYGIKTTKHGFILKGCKGNRIFRNVGLCLRWGESSQEHLVRKSTLRRVLIFFSA